MGRDGGDLDSSDSLSRALSALESLKSGLCMTDADIRTGRRDGDHALNELFSRAFLALGRSHTPSSKTCTDIDIACDAL